MAAPPILILVLGSLLMAAPAHSQSPRLLLQVGPAGGSGEFAGVGANVSVEQELPASLRVAASWTNWQALASCAVVDAPSECSANAHLWELGLRYGIPTGEGFTPLFGAGAGVYRRRPSTSEASNRLMASVRAGMDFNVGTAMSIRLSIVFQHVFDDDRATLYGSDVQVVGLLLGLGFPLW